MAWNAEKKSLEVFLQGSTLCVQKNNNEETTYIVIPHKILTNTISEIVFFERLKQYAFGNKVKNIAIDISYDARKYISNYVY